MTTASRQRDLRFAEQVRTAPFIFTGQVVTPGATTLAALAPDERLAVVRIDTVFRAPAVLGPIEGKRVTIQLARGRPMKAGARALFYATSWLYAEGIAVVELAREPVPRNPKDVLARVAQAELRLEDDKLGVRLRRAELVVSGVVGETGPLEGERAAPRSEHDPVWWRADIAVERIEKGQADGTRVTAFFPSSLDEYWLDTPKLVPGQRGVFILHREKGRMPAPGPALLDPLDFQPPGHLERVRAALKAGSA